MWSLPKSVGTPTLEPLVIADARRQCRIGTDTSFDAEMTRLIAVARDHVEKYCTMRFAERPITAECTDWSDMARLPEAPLKTVTTIKYFDDAGVQQTVADTVYEIGGSRFAPLIKLKTGQEWPEMQDGGSIELVAVFGGDVPETAQQAMLLLIAHWFSTRETVNIGNIVSVVPMAVDDLLCNERRGNYA